MQTEVKTKLTVDDHATEALNKVREGFHKFGDKVGEVQHELGGMVKQAAAVAIGFQLSHGIDSVKEFGMEIFHAAENAGKQQKSLAGLLAMTDKTGMSFDETFEHAKGLHEELENIGINAGVASDSVINAFESIASRSSKSTEEVKGLTEQMAMAGNALPGGVEQLADAFRDMETGIVRPRNAIVQLIKQTGVAGGSMKQIAKGLSGLMQSGQQEKAFAIAEQAINRMSKKMEKAPLGFGAVVQSLKDVRENLFETMGEPLLKSVTTQLRSAQKFLKEHREEIEKFAKTIGTRLGEWVTAAAVKMEQAFKYLQTHADEIMTAIEKTVGVIRDVIAFAVEHRTALMVAYGAKTAVGAGMAVKESIAGGGGAIGAFASLGKLVASASGMAPSLAATAASMGVMAVAVGAVGAAVYQAIQLYNELPFVQDRAAKAERAAADAAEQAAKEKQYREANNQARTFGVEAQKGNAANSSEELMRLFADAKKRGNAAQMDYIAGLVEGNELIMGGLKVAGEDFVANGQELANRVMSPETKARIEKALAAAKSQTTSILQDFSGSTFNIKQDFRDADPDRIAITFRQDIMKHVNSRTGSRPGMGLFSGGGT